jgi:phage internal scaffolding protein
MTKAKVFLRTAYNYDMDEVSEETGLACSEATLAKQEFRDECDINTIIARFGIGYELPEAAHPPSFADFEDVMDFQSAMNSIVAARESFMLLSGEVRARFGNDPQSFVEFCSDSKNYDELIKLGFAVERPAPQAPIVPAKEVPIVPAKPA